MHIVWWILTIIFVISGINGIFRIVKPENHKLGSSILIFVISLIGSCSFYTLATHQQQLSKAEQQKVYKTFLAKIDQENKPVNDAANTFQSTFQQAINGQANINDIYSSAKSLNDQYQQCHLDFSDISAPTGFTSDISQSLNDATQELSTAYFIRTEGMNSLLKYFDDQKPSELKTYKDDMTTGNSYISDATNKLLDAQMKINAEK